MKNLNESIGRDHLYEKPVYRPGGFRRFRIGDDSPGTTEQRTHDSTPATSGQTCLSVTWY